MAETGRTREVSYTSRAYTWLRKPNLSLEELEVARARLMSRQRQADESTQKDIRQALIAIEAKRNDLIKGPTAAEQLHEVQPADINDERQVRKYHSEMC